MDLNPLSQLNHLQRHGVCRLVVQLANTGDGVGGEWKNTRRISNDVGRGNLRVVISEDKYCINQVCTMTANLMARG